MRMNSDYASFCLFLSALTGRVKGYQKIKKKKERNEKKAVKRK